MLFLNESDTRKAVTMKDVIDAIDSTYETYESNQFQMPERMQVNDNDNTLLLMPCLTKDAIGTKLVTLFPNNQSLPTLHGLVILNSSETGEIKAILNGSFLTGLRTGAIGGSATRHLANKDDTKLAIIGTGVQGMYQAIAACTERPITDIYLYNRSVEKIPAFKKTLQEWIGTKIQLHSMISVEDAIQNADIIITATTSTKPVLPDSSRLLENKLIVGVGSFQPSMREFPESLYQLTDQIIVDTEHAIHESGDLVTPLKEGWINKDSIKKMSSYILNNKKNALREERSVVFKSTGMALFDVVVANLIYQRALEKGVGTQLDL